jgi:hypothetical protein
MAESEVLVLFKGKDETLSKVAGSVGGAFGKLGGAVKAGAAVGVGAMIGLGAGAVTLGSKLIGLGSDAEEMQGKFNVVFANTGNQVTSVLSDFADEVGRSKFELMEMASVFGDTLKPMGFVEQDAAALSIQMSQLATDLGSFSNMSMTESMERLQGVLIGNHENALAFGVIINENTLSAELAANGWDNLTGAALEQAKVQARINLLMAGTTDAQGDAARTAGSWANQMRRLKSRLADAATEAGSKLLPALTPLLSLLGDLAEQALPVLLGAFDRIAPVIENVSQFIRSLVGNLQEGMSPMDAFIEAIWDFAPQPVLDALVNFRDVILPGLIEKITEIKDKIIEFMEPIVNWIVQNIQLKDALMALGIVLGGIVLGAIVSVATAILPIIAAGAALIGIVALVREAWSNNWGDIQGKTQIFIDFWNTVLWPGLQQVWQWMQDVLFPFFANVLAPAIGELLVTASEKLSTFWNDTLKPAMEAIWEFISVTLMPIWEELAELLGVFVPLASETLVLLWNNALLPAMQAIWEFVKNKLGPIWEWFKESVMDQLVDSLMNVVFQFERLIEWVGKVKKNLDNFSLPEVLTPGSPTPFELGLRGIGEQMRILANNDIPQFNNAMQQTGSTTVNAQRTVNQNFTINTSSIDVQSESRAQLAFATGGI